MKYNASVLTCALQLGLLQWCRPLLQSAWWLQCKKLQSRRKRPQHYFHHSTKRLHKIRKSVTPSLSPFRTEKVLCLLISVLELQPIFSCNSRIPKKRTLKASNRLKAITQPQGRNKSCLRVRQEVTGSCAAAAGPASAADGCLLAAG